MAQPVLRGWLVIPILLSVGCTAMPTIMPTMESRLETWQFHPNMYVVQAGETLDTIAFRYNLSMAELRTLNPGIDSQFTPGLRINVRPGTQLAASVRARSGYTRPNQPQLTAQRPSLTQPGVSINPTNSAEIIVTEIPAAARTAPIPRSTALPRLAQESTVVPAPASAAHPREEIIADTLEYQPAQSQQQQQMNAELQQYVGRWYWPTDGQVAREYSAGAAGAHGVDIAGVPGQNVRAVASGQVIYSGRNPSSGGGNLVIIRHDDNLMTTYGHTDKLFVSEHDFVQAGDTLATLGENVKNESVLAFEVRRDGKPLNPLEFLPVR